MPRPLALFAILLCASPVFAQVPAGPGEWPQWRGPNRDGVSEEKGLLREWPKEGPPVVWQIDSVGVGYSSLAIKGDRIFTQGDLNGVEHVIALSVKDGSRLWAVSPPGLADRVDARVASEWKQADRNQDVRVDEGEALARRALALGLHLSFSGIVAFPRSQGIQEVAAACPLDRLLVETDAPFLAPPPHRGKRNEPAFVVEVARKVASLRGVDAETVGAAALANCRRLFGRPSSR